MVAEIILAIDVGTQTGVARRVGTVVVECWTHQLGGSDGSERLLHFWRWLHELAPQPHLVVFERPFAQGAAKRQLDSYVTAIELWAMTHGIRWIGVAPATLKKAITGSGRAKKFEMIAAVRALYPRLDIQDDNQADAVGLIHYVTEARTQ